MDLTIPLIFLNEFNFLLTDLNIRSYTKNVEHVQTIKLRMVVEMLVAIYWIYLAISVGPSVWVARSLLTNEAARRFYGGV